VSDFLFLHSFALVEVVVLAQHDNLSRLSLIFNVTHVGVVSDACFLEVVELILDASILWPPSSATVHHVVFVSPQLLNHLMLWVSYSLLVRIGRFASDILHAVALCFLRLQLYLSKALEGQFELMLVFMGETLTNRIGSVL